MSKEKSETSKEVDCCLECENTATRVEANIGYTQELPSQKTSDHDIDTQWGEVIRKNNKSDSNTQTQCKGSQRKNVKVVVVPIKINELGIPSELPSMQRHDELQGAKDNLRDTSPIVEDTYLKGVGMAIPHVSLNIKTKMRYSHDAEDDNHSGRLLGKVLEDNVGGKPQMDLEYSSLVNENFIVSENLEDELVESGAKVLESYSDSSPKHTKKSEDPPKWLDPGISSIPSIFLYCEVN